MEIVLYLDEGLKGGAEFNILFLSFKTKNPRSRALNLTHIASRKLVKGGRECSGFLVFPSLTEGAVMPVP
jgi:hypothetical protein